ncbi:MAG: pyridoxal phosphate-dependent aminotransferase, partial [Lachnospiraceae bacterium]|nr:pyridoxal phosphate-dependent aminotransferase [Lachnospiraceae bacterium]
MKYDFDKIIDRHNTGSLKWDVAYNELPMWVADMDFETAPEIIDALKKRVEHGVFGYSILPKEWEDAYITWWRDRHNFEIEPEWLTFCTGVVPAISSIVRKITTPAEKVIIQTPVYNIFFNSILNNGRNVIESELVYNGKDYHIDFEDLEEKLADPQTSLMILCNPHNPVGKIWDKDTLSKIGELCYKHNVVVLSDEIHCDITDLDSNYVPFASVSDICKNNSITCIAPTKAFNIAGLQTAAVVIPNKNLHHKVWRGLNTDEVAEPNAFAVAATVAAFNEGGEWLNELKRYITDNKAYVREFIERELPMLNLTPSKATYLLWLDCSNVTDDATVFADQIREYNGLY